MDSNRFDKVFLEGDTSLFLAHIQCGWGEAKIKSRRL